jgi:hypothetical protein
VYDGMRGGHGGCGCSSTCSLTMAERLSRLVAHMGKPVGLFVRSHRRR